MPRPSITQIRTNADFQKSYNWEFQFLRYPSFLSAADASRYNLQCISTDLPKKTNDTATIMMRGEQIFDPGISKVSGTISLTFIETVDNFVRNMISAWEDAVDTKPDSFVNLTADIRLVTYDTQQNENYAYILYYAYLQDCNIPQLEGGTSDPYQPGITLQYTDYSRQSLGSAGNAGVNR